MLNSVGAVLAGVAADAFQRHGEIDDRTRVFFLVVALLELRFLGQCVFQRHAEGGWNQLGDAVDEAVAVPEHAPAIAHHGLGCHVAIGDDLADLVAPVAVGDVVEHPVAFLHAEVHVEIRHGHPFRI